MLDSKIVEKVRKYVKTNELLEKNDKVLIAFSGGPDSVFLFYILNSLKEEYNLSIELVYVNHKIRDDVELDISFVKLFSYKNDVEYHIKEINLGKLMKENKLSEEEAGRYGRYKVFSNIMEEKGLNKVATGHNLDDNIETFIFRMLRGTSLNGLKGIPVKRGNIIRPILDFKKEDILNILDNVNEEYRIDSTNLEIKYTRNKIRNLIFPLFNEINPLFKEKVFNLINEINDLEIEEKNENGELKLSKLINLSKAEQNKQIFSLISSYNIQINREKIRQIRDLINSEGNKEINLGNSFILYKNYDKLEVIFKKENEYELQEQKLKLGQTLEWGNYILMLVSIDKKIEFNEDIKTIFLDKNSEISIRSRKEGDRIYLKNLGYKKIKKILIDEKVEKRIRNLIPIIEVDKEIAAVGDIKISGKLAAKELLNEDRQVKLIIRRKNAK
ncbi:MAG: tRNA lysidine(34) synthetase TilS [Sebaldella sp.]|nr:tRNA lysidine(34) synthetase TilS [Sebaldella sp.]